MGAAFRRHGTWGISQHGDWFCPTQEVGQPFPDSKVKSLGFSLPPPTSAYAEQCPGREEHLNHMDFSWGITETFYEE